jgi:hypothetical protein
MRYFVLQVFFVRFNAVAFDPRVIVSLPLQPTRTGQDSTLAVGIVRVAAAAVLL